MVFQFAIPGFFATVVIGSMVLSGFAIGVTYLWVDLKKDQLEHDIANDADRDLRNAKLIAGIEQYCIEEGLSTFDCNARIIECYEYIAKWDDADIAGVEPSLLENAAKYFGTSIENMKYLIIAVILALILTRG